MGAQKLLLPFGAGAGQTVIGHIVDQVIAGPVARTFVVVPASAAEVAAGLAGKPVTLVHNPDSEGDMLSSARCGLRALPPDCEAVLVALGDQPGLRADLIGRMIDEFRRHPGGIVVPVHQGRRGHPLLFSVRYAAEVLERYDDVGLRGLLQAHPADVRELADDDPAVLADMDRPEDYRRELDRLAGKTTEKAAKPEIRNSTSETNPKSE